MKNRTNYLKNYRTKNRIKLRKKQREYYYKNRNEIYRRQKIYKQSKKGKESERRYRQTNKRKEVIAKYENTPKGKLLRKVIPLRAREKKEFGEKVKITREDYSQIFKLYKNKCFNCGKKNKQVLVKSGRRYLPIVYVEHFYPLKRGYGFYYKGFNFSLLCHSCNLKKGSKMPYHFYSKEKMQEFKAIKQKWLKYKRGIGENYE